MTLPKPYYQQLMAAAERLIEQNELAPAVITAFTACEVLTEQLFDELWRSRGLPQLARPIGMALRSNNLADDRVRTVYNALSQDRIENQLFWPSFKEFAKLRNGLVHGNERNVPLQRVRDAIEAAKSVQDYIMRRLYPFALPPAP